MDKLRQRRNLPRRRHSAGQVSKFFEIPDCDSPAYRSRSVPTAVGCCTFLILVDSGLCPLFLADAPARTQKMTGLRHGHHAHRYLRAIPSWRSSNLTGLRHGHHAHRYLSGIPAWQSSHLNALRHGHPAHTCLRAIPAWQR